MRARFTPSLTFGILIFMASNVFHTLTDASAQYFVKFLGVNALFIISLRFLTGQISSTAIGFSLSGPGLWRTNHLARNLLRSVLMAGTTLTNFWALAFLDLTVTITIIFSTPFLVALFAWLFLGERVGFHRLIAIGVGFLGVLVVTNPFGESFHPAMLLSLGTALCMAGLAIVTRLGTNEDSLGTQAFYTTLVGAVVCLPFLFFIETPLPTKVGDWVLLLAIGLVFGTCGHFANVVAHRFAPASTIAPFMYLQLLWMAVAQYVLYREPPRIETYIGAALVIVSGLYLWHRQQLHRAQSGDQTDA